MKIQRKWYWHTLKKWWKIKEGDIQSKSNTNLFFFKWEKIGKSARNSKKKKWQMFEKWQK